MTSLCTTELMPILRWLIAATAALAVSGALGAALWRPLKVSGWNGHTRVERRLLVALAAVAGLAGLAWFAGEPSAQPSTATEASLLPAWASASVGRCLALAAATSLALALTAFLIARLALLARLHRWLDVEDSASANSTSARQVDVDALVASNLRLEQMAAAGHWPLVVALAVTVILATWVGLDGRCAGAMPPSDPAAATDGDQRP